MDADLTDIAAKLTSPGKGVLASDESTSTIGKRLAKSGIDNTEVRRSKSICACLACTLTVMQLRPARAGEPESVQRAVLHG